MLQREQVYSHSIPKFIQLQKTTWCRTNQTMTAQPTTKRHSGHFLTAALEGIIGSEFLTKLWSERDVTGTSLTMEIEECLKNLQLQGVRMNRIEEIREYLRRFPDMIGATEEIVKEAFSSLPEAQFVLEVYQDPEIEDEHLVLYVRFKNYPQDVMEKIRGVRERCRAYLVGRKGWLHLTTDFYPAE